MFILEFNENHLQNVILKQMKRCLIIEFTNYDQIITHNHLRYN